MLLTKVWKTQPGKYFFLSTKDRFGRWEDHSFKRSEFEQIQEFINENLDKDVYWCVHGFSKPRRLKENAEIPKILWADLDEVDPRELDEKGLMPSIAWQSSPGRFCGIWNIDHYMTEELNQALTQHIGADPGGWDLTQVLRVPGTKNYKYPDKPTVKTLWSDGEDYTTLQIEKKLPKKVKEKTKPSPTDATAIYKKYEKKFTAFVRRELIGGKPVEGKRSEVIWKLVHELLEAGCSSDETFELLRVSPWNKFKERRDGDKQLRREINKATDQHLTVSTDKRDSFRETTKRDKEDDKEEKKPLKLLAIGMDKVEEEEIDWLWYPYLARGELTILEGDPGLGKSYLAQVAGVHFVDGKKLPSPRPMKTKGPVAYFDMENSPGSVTKKRLLQNGCVNLRDFIQEDHVFSIEDEDAMKAVDDALHRVKPVMVVFDTINAYLGAKVDTYRSSEVTEAFKQFVEIARHHNCAVLILRHLTKGSGEGVKAIYRGQGSIAFAGLARVIITMGAHPDDPDLRVVAVTKLNIGQKPKALTFKINKLEAKLNDLDRSQLEWGDWIDLTSDELMVVSSAKNKERTIDVEIFLEEILEAGPMSFDKILRAATVKKIGKKLLYRVADMMGLVKEQGGYGKSKGSVWALPNRRKTASASAS